LNHKSKVALEDIPVERTAMHVWYGKFKGSHWGILANANKYACKVVGM